MVMIGDAPGPSPTGRMSATARFGVTPRRNGSRVELFLSGEFDVAAVPRFRQALEDELNRGGRRVVVDLAELEFIDAAGIAELVGANRRAGTCEGALSIRSPQPTVRRVLDITGVLGSLQLS
jgi:anti-sigma B factor antagonist